MIQLFQKFQKKHFSLFAYTDSYVYEATQILKQLQLFRYFTKVIDATTLDPHSKRAPGAAKRFFELTHIQPNRTLFLDDCPEKLAVLKQYNSQICVGLVDNRLNQGKAAFKGCYDPIITFQHVDYYIQDIPSFFKTFFQHMRGG